MLQKYDKDFLIFRKGVKVAKWLVAGSFCIAILRKMKKISTHLYKLIPRRTIISFW